MKKQIVAKRYGKNLVVVIDGEKRTRVINTEKDKQDEEVIKTKIANYNKKNNQLLLEEIIYLVDTTKREREEKEAREKGTKKAIKKEVKKGTKEAKSKEKSVNDLVNTLRSTKLNSENIAELENILAKAKGVQKKTETPAKPTKSAYSGEH